MKNMLLIINPVAGKSAVGHQLLEIIDIFVKGGYDVNVVATQSKEHLIQVVETRGENFDIVVCCGGDGTLNLTVGAICNLKKKPLVGYIPAGTTNDFAKSRGISTVPIEAAKRIVDGSYHQIDVGFFDGRPFVYIAAFGVFSEVSYTTPRQMKQNIGHAAYVVEGIKSLSKSEGFKAKFFINGDVIEGEFLYGMCSNTIRIGGFQLPLIGDFDMDDGLIDVTLIRNPKNIDETNRLWNSFVAQQSDGDMIMQFRTSRLSYESDREIPWTLDGEFGGESSKQFIELKPHYINMVY